MGLGLRLSAGLGMGWGLAQGLELLKGCSWGRWRGMGSLWWCHRLGCVWRGVQSLTILCGAGLGLALCGPLCLAAMLACPCVARSSHDRS